jgi:hypothetical protein
MSSCLLDGHEHGDRQAGDAEDDGRAEEEADRCLALVPVVALVLGLGRVVGSDQIVQAAQRF